MGSFHPPSCPPLQSLISPPTYSILDTGASPQTLLSFPGDFTKPQCRSSFSPLCELSLSSLLAIPIPLCQPPVPRNPSYVGLPEATLGWNSGRQFTLSVLSSIVTYLIPIFSPVTTCLQVPHQPPQLIHWKFQLLEQTQGPLAHSPCLSRLFCLTAAYLQDPFSTTPTLLWDPASRCEQDPLRVFLNPISGYASRPSPLLSAIH